VSVASTYAEALYEGALDKGVVPRVSEEIAALRAAYDEVPELRAALTNPEIDHADRKTAAQAVLAESDPTVRNFVLVLIDRGRMHEFPEIAKAFAERVQDATGRLAVTVTTAVPLTDELRKALEDRLRDETGLQLELTERIDPEIVGGMVIDASGTVVDASVRRSIDDMRERLSLARIDTATTA